MKVYVVETDIYENHGIDGVFATPESAMAAHPIPTGMAGAWRQNGPGHWTNGLDWADAAEITEYEVEA